MHKQPITQSKFPSGRGGSNGVWIPQTGKPLRCGQRKFFCLSRPTAGKQLLHVIDQKKDRSLKPLPTPLENSFERDVAQAGRSASDVIELSTRHNLPFWLAIGSILRGWVLSVSGESVEGISWIEQGIKDYRAPGSTLGLPYFLALKAEALFAANRSSEALEAVEEAEAIAQKCEARFWSPELQRLHAVFLAATGAEEAQIAASLCEAIRIAQEQKSVSLEKRAE